MKKQNQLRLGVILISTLLVGFGSCSVSVEEICNERMASFTSGVVTAQSELNSFYKTVYPGRKLASLEAKIPKKIRGEDVPDYMVRRLRSPLNEDERGQWMKWSEVRLHEVQAYLDQLEDGGPTPLKRELSEVANLLVVFHGYADYGNVNQMIEITEGMQGHLKAINESYCRRPTALE